MLNNVLIALAGVEGAAFYFDGTYPTSKLKASAAKDCHPGEVEALQRVTGCGALVHEITKFKYPSGLYSDALKFVITKIVDEYFDDVIKCEREIVRSTDFYSLTQLETIFSAHSMRLEFIHFLLKYVLQKYHGVGILNWLIKSVVGDPTVRGLVSRVISALSVVFINQLQSWMIYGELFDPFSEFMIIPKVLNGKEQSYKIIDSKPEFISKKVLDMILEIGNLKRTLNGLYNDKSNHNRLSLNVNDWEMLVQESLLKLPQILISDTFGVEIIFGEIYKSLSQKISTFLLESGVTSTLSVLRASFLGGRGDLTSFLHDSFQSFRLEEVAETSAILNELDCDSFKILPHDAQHDHDIDMYLWYQVSQELSLFLTESDIERYSKINKFLVKVKFCQNQVSNMFYFRALTSKEVLLKRKMNEFINSFWSYLQMDVISTKFADLISSMESLTYHGMLEKHHNVLDKIEIGCFLRNELILKRINNLMTTISQLSVLITGPRESEYRKSLAILTMAFDKDFIFLLKSIMPS